VHRKRAVRTTATIRSFVREPSRVRAYVVLGVLVVASPVIFELLDGSVVLLALWLVAVGATLLLLLHDGAGAVANTISIVVGRPVALTARSRERMDLERIAPETRRQLRVALLAMMALAVLGLVLAVTNG
jgi:hypothetical protein